MELGDFIGRVQNFSSMAQSDHVLHFSWYLHTHRKKDVIDKASVRACFKSGIWTSPT